MPTRPCPPIPMATTGIRHSAFRPEGGARRHRWIGRILPAAAQERWLWIGLAATVVILKCVAIFHFRVDSDETQHAHVVWAVANGQLPYRDVFDNHMPLFQMACAPLFHLLGEHGYIMIELRFAMLALFFVSLWCVFRLAEDLFPRGVAPWAALSAAALPQFFYTSTEFRPDDLWAAFWLIGLVVALSGKFTPKRAFAFGVVLGFALAASLKTALLAASIGIAAVIALGLARQARLWKSVPLRLLLIVGGAMIVPGCVVWYFAGQGALRIMYYCVIQHNIFPGLRSWHRFRYDAWIFPASLPLLIGLAILTYRQATDSRTAIRRVIVVLTPCIYISLLISYWREITREDDLPYAPLLPLAALPLILWLHRRLEGGRGKSLLVSAGFPLVCAIEIVCVWRNNPLRTNRVQATTAGIRDVLLLSGPGDFVMDAKGDNVFRARPTYWVFEPLTKARIRKGLIDDQLPADMVRTETRLCYLSADRWEPAAASFIGANYMAFDKASLDLGAAGKEMESSSSDGTFFVDVAIPARYAIVSESGGTAGILDGHSYSAPVRLEPGRHWLRRTSGGGRAAIFLAEAFAHGFHPLFEDIPKPLRAK